MATPGEVVVLFHTEHFRGDHAADMTKAATFPASTTLGTLLDWADRNRLHGMGEVRATIEIPPPAAPPEPAQGG